METDKPSANKKGNRMLPVDEHCDQDLEEDNFPTKESREPSSANVGLDDDIVDIFHAEEDDFLLLRRTGQLEKLAEYRKEREIIRTEFTKTKATALKEIRNMGSRTYIEFLVKKLDALNEQMRSSTIKISLLLDPTEAKKDCVKQDYYDQELEQVQFTFKYYVVLKKDYRPLRTSVRRSVARQAKTHPQENWWHFVLQRFYRKAMEFTKYLFSFVADDNRIKFERAA